MAQDTGGGGRAHSLWGLKLCGSKVPQFTLFCFSVPEMETGKLAPPGAGVRRNYNSESSLFHLLGVEALWRGRRRGGGGQGQSSRGSPSEFGSSPSLEAKGAAFQELRPEAGPKLGTVPKSQRSPGAWAAAHSLAPFPITTPSPLSSFQDSGGAVLLEVEAGRLGRG